MCRAGLIFCLVLVLWTAPFVRAADDPKAPIPTAWGKPVNGLQAGIRVSPKGHTGSLDLEVVVRNIGKKVIEFDHLQLAFGGENSEGTVTAKGVEVYGSFTPKGTRFQAKLAPGESHRIARVPLSRPGESDGIIPTPKVRLGENRVGAEGVVVRLAGEKEVELATGYLDVQITPPKK
jgi:hypothetical protein